MKNYVLLFKALSDETRLKIMILLSEKELCVCKIEAALDSSQAKVSRHLTVLRNAGLVASRRDGQWIYYSIVKPKSCLEEKIFSCFKDCLRTKDLPYLL
jgi:ArsR family transcriptional regulator